MIWNARLVAVVIAAIFPLAAACAQKHPGNRTGTVLIVDFSQTFAPLTKDDASALERVFDSLELATRRKRLETPTKIYVTTLGDTSLSPPSPCGPAIVFQPKMFTTAADEQMVTSYEALRTKLGVCKDALVALSANNTERFTDISGAVALAQGNLKAIQGEKLLVLYSDFLEDLPPTQTVAAFELDGTRVLMVWRPGLDDTANRTMALARLASWEERFRQSGAASVCQLSVSGLTAPDIVACVWPGDTQ